MILAELLRDRLVSALASLVSLPVDSVDIDDEGEFGRNWSAPVLGTISPGTGDVHSHLAVYFSEAIVPPPTEAAVATWLAQHLEIAVAYPSEELSDSAYWLVDPDALPSKARIEDIGPEIFDAEAEYEPVYRIEAVEHLVPTLPDLPVAAMPEAIHEHLMPTPITDQLKVALRPWSSPQAPEEEAGHARSGLGAWEAMVARLAAGWPPDGWYPAGYYWEDLELRDELARAGQTLPDPACTPFAAALHKVDQRFVALTEEDGGAALAAEMGAGYAVPDGTDRWWWRRIPRPVPWQDQPGRPASQRSDGETYPERRLISLSRNVSGSGPVVVLLHSIAADRRMWDPQFPVLIAAGYRVVWCDLRGFGETPVPDRPFNNAQDVIDLLELLRIERAALVGSSGGGGVALEIAARWPQRVTCLALICTAMAEHEPSDELRRFAEREAALLDAGDIAGATKLNVDTWLGPHADAATRNKLGVMQRHAFQVQLADEEVEPIRVEYELSAITAPTLLISGRHDVVDFRQIAAGLVDQLPDARHLELDWAGHLPSLERPEMFNPVLLDFLGEAIRR